MTTIGETFPSSSIINGVVFSVRQHNKISLWLSESTQNQRDELIKKMKEIIPVESDVVYQSHD